MSDTTLAEQAERILDRFAQGLDMGDANGTVSQEQAVRLIESLAISFARARLAAIDRQLQADDYFTSASEMYGQELGVHRGLWKAHDLIAAETRQLLDYAE